MLEETPGAGPLDFETYEGEKSESTIEHADYEPDGEAQPPLAEGPEGAEGAPTGEEYQYGPEGGPSDEYQETVDYRILDDLRVLSESYGEKGGTMLDEWINQWRQLIIQDEHARMKEWFEKIRRDYGPRLVGHRQCHRKNFLYLTDKQRATQRGQLPFDEMTCGVSCIK